MLKFNGEYPAVHLKGKFCRFLSKNCKKLDVKYSIEKSLLVDFVNLFPTFCQTLPEESDFHF